MDCSYMFRYMKMFVLLICNFSHLRFINRSNNETFYNISVGVITMKSLVIYYSYEGSTQIVAEAIARQLVADLQRVNIVKEMTSKGLGKYFWGGQQVVMKQKPKLHPIDVNFDEYDMIFVGSPVWAWTYAPAIRTLLSDGLIKNKDIYFFCAHEGGIKGVEARAKSLIEKHNRYLGFKDFLNVATNRAAIIKEATDWAQSIANK